jgi:hypothetical protein
LVGRGDEALEAAKAAREACLCAVHLLISVGALSEKSVSIGGVSSEAGIGCGTGQTPGTDGGVAQPLNIAASSIESALKRHGFGLLGTIGLLGLGRMGRFDDSDLITRRFECDGLRGLFDLVPVLIPGVPDAEDDHADRGETQGPEFEGREHVSPRS